jgi:hypothetical protein|tara:strand:- start:492 stop:1286 length:795 start_codon:yes stop_codon:yes gene_type:complete
MTELDLKQENTSVSKFDPSIILEDAGTASENMTNDDMLIPRLRILQALSPQVSKADSAYKKGAEAGMIFDNVTEELYNGEEGITVVPVKYRKTHLEWTQERKIVADHGLNCTELLSKCKEDDKGKLITPDNNVLSITAEYFVFTVDKDGAYTPALVSMSGSGLKKAKKWNSMMNRLQIPHPDGNSTINPAMFWNAYILTTVPEQNDLGSWFNWEVTMKYDAKSGGIIKNLPTGESIYLEARSFRKKVTEGKVNASGDDSDEIPF